MIRAACKAIEEQLQSPLARVGQACLSTPQCGDDPVAEGEYYILLFSHSVTSIRSRTILEAVAWDTARGALLDPESSERLLYLTVERGAEWKQSQNAPAMPEVVWQRLYSEARRRSNELRAAERRENQSRYLRQRGAIQAEYEHAISIKQQRLKTPSLEVQARSSRQCRGDCQPKVCIEQKWPNWRLCRKRVALSE